MNTKTNFDEDLRINSDFYFNREELAETFGLARSTVCKMIKGIPHAGVRDRGLVWHIADVTTLKDAQKKKQRKVVENNVEVNPEKRTPKERLLHHQAEGLKQSALLKQRRNDVESGVLIPALEVEKALATAFKTVALTLDTLPDALERDGMISSADVEGAIALIDVAREQLANDLANLSN